ncbi:MAG: nuclear mRNA export, poly(A)+RNA binding protein [Candelina mexicana]|nr:MAG: nuclear mRNA export, poly(A)+RNA binding protein [Candelina mexicana]
MLQQPPLVPTGPRGSDGNTRRNQGHAPSRAGIQKRRGGAPRTDRDGDLVMDAAAGRGRARGGPSRPGHPYPTNTTNGSRGGTRGGAARGLPDPRRILQGMNSENAIINRPRTNIGLRGILKEASDSGRGRSDKSAIKLDHISVRGWTESKAASNADGGIKDLQAFLERKATGTTTPARDAVRIVKSRQEGDSFIISVKAEDTPKIMRLQDYQFAGASLKLEQIHGNTDIDSKNESLETVGVKQTMMNFLASRYEPSTKLLNLSALGKDQFLINMGIFNSVSTESKFFPVLMTVCDLSYETPQQKRDAVDSISLANNELSNVGPITTLSQTFPELKNLDLSNNKISDLRSIEQWRWKFRFLDHLVLTGNPIENQASYKDDILKWYPTLRMLNGVQVRSDVEVARALATVQGKLPLPIQGPNFQDEANIAENFIKAFFANFDTNRAQLTATYYDTQSTFSLAVNTSAKNFGHQVRWDEYIKKSRNLKKINQLPARMDRMYTGTESISNCWATLPTTRHPDLIAESTKWNIECNSLPGLPDPTGQSPGGVGGLMIMVHGSFDEMDVSTGKVRTTRSFDRTFLLGPGAVPGGIRVVTDAMNLRAYGGHEAWVPEQAWMPEQPLASGQAVVSLTGGSAEHAARVLAELGDPQVPHGFAVALKGKPYEQVQNELKVLEMSHRTRMTLEYSSMCLETGGWNLEEALRTFENVKGTLGREVFL